MLFWSLGPLLQFGFVRQAASLSYWLGDPVASSVRDVLCWLFCYWEGMMIDCKLCDRHHVSQIPSFSIVSASNFSPPSCVPFF